MFTESEFNKAMTEFEGRTVYENSNGYYYHKFDGGHAFHLPLLGYYNDLNQLMPLAWKNEVNVVLFADSWFASTNDTLDDEPNNQSINKDPIQAIRECLWLIHKENIK